MLVVVAAAQLGPPAAAQLGPPAAAQMPTLPTFPGDPNAPSPPSTSAPPSTAPRGSTTTTILLPLLPEESPLPPPAPDSTAPTSPGVLPSLTTVPARRTTAYKPPPIPPSTPARPLLSPKARSAGSNPARPADADDQAEEGFVEDLPFLSGGGTDVATGRRVLELGAESSERDLVSSYSSVAAGLIAAVLLGVASWLRREARRAPADGRPLPDVLPW